MCCNVRGLLIGANPNAPSKAQRAWAKKLKPFARGFQSAEIILHFSYQISSKLSVVCFF
jgi:hypothetical protein